MWSYCDTKNECKYKASRDFMTSVYIVVDQILQICKNKWNKKILNEAALQLFLTEKYRFIFFLHDLENLNLCSFDSSEELWVICPDQHPQPEHHWWESNQVS